MELEEEDITQLRILSLGFENCLGNNVLIPELPYWFAVQLGKMTD